MTHPDAHGQDDGAPAAVSPGAVAPTSVACVIPCYGCAETLARAVRSVQAQTVAVAEIILVDDCSPDDTWEAITALAADDPRIRPIRLAQNAGPSRARNIGWDAATSTYIAFLDADDTWHPRKVELQLRLFRLRPELGITGHLAAVEGEPGTDAAHELDDAGLLAVTRAITRGRVVTSNPWSTPTVMLRRAIALRFDEDQRAAEDYLLWAQILLSGTPGRRIELPLAILYKARYGAGGLSGNLWNMERGELTSIRKLMRRGHIGPLEYAAVSLFSLAKYLKRVVRT